MRLIALFATVAALALAVSPALAGKGNGGGNDGGSAGGGGSSKPSATLTISPNDAPAWSRVWGSGCGYEVGKDVYIDVQKPSALGFLGAVPDGNGCISFTFTTDDPGMYAVSARQQLSNGTHWTVMATYDLPVVA